MKAGLFLCDRVAPEYIDKFGDYSDMFAQLFPEFEWTIYEVYRGVFPKNLEECDVYFASGSHHSVYEDIDWIIELKKVIRKLYEQKKYFVGFCFGHQLLGESLSGKVEKSPNGWCVGVHEFEINSKEEWMQPSLTTVNLLMMCQDQIIKLPENSTVLATSEKCPVGMIQVGEKMLGIQAHPEFSKAYDRILMEARVERMGAAVVKEGLDSLAKAVDRETVRRWVLNFLNYQQIQSIIN